jgi:hypothetical protein
MAHWLAHFNLAIARYPLDHPSLAEFVAELDVVNQIARSSQGFIWTAEGAEAGDPVAIFGSTLALANISVWRSIEALKEFTYQGQHGDALRRRFEWFDRPEGPAYVLWWIPAGGRPDYLEGKKRLEHLAAHGPSEYAFNFASPFSATGASPPLS